VSTLTALCGASLIAIRRSDLFFMQGVMSVLRLIFVVYLLSFGVLGIILAQCLPLVIAAIVSGLLLIRSGVGLNFRIDRYFLRSSLSFSASNYLAGLLNMAPALILPILVLNRLGAEQAAYYYISFSICSVLFVIPAAIGTSLFAEGVNSGHLKDGLFKSVLMILFFLVPLVIVIFVSGDKLLTLFGNRYIAGFDLLKTMSLSSFPVAVCSMYISLERIKGKNRNIISISALICLTLIAANFILIGRIGLIGVGYSWLFSYCICSLALLRSLSRDLFEEMH